MTSSWGRGPEAPSYSALTGAQKALIRKLGSSEDHTLVSASGTPGKGWLALELEGWVHIREQGFYGGYTIVFTLRGWERWCQQVDVEDGLPPSPLVFE